MKRNIEIMILLIVLCLFLFTNRSSASVQLINTGTSVNPDITHQALDPGVGYEYFKQSLAIEFNLTESAEITDLVLYMKREASQTIYDDNYVKASLWTDGGNIPGSPIAGDEVQFVVNNTSWHSPTVPEFAWYVNAGTDYWIVFDGVGESISTTYMASSAIGTTQYANANYHYTWPYDTSSVLQWAPQDYDLYVVALGNPVPIPGAVWLLGSGLIGLVGIRRKIRK